MATQSDTKSRNWSITINNPTDDDNILIAGLTDLTWVKEVKGQLEQGENGTPHYQMMLKTDNVRFSQVKKALPRAHIEPARNAAALANYVVKQDTRVSSIPTVRVATQRDLQEHILQTVLQESDLSGCKIESAEQIRSYLLDKQFEFTGKNPRSKKTIYEHMLDDAVAALIRKGFYGIEMVCSNNQVRNAFIKYLPDIMYRSYNASQAQASVNQEVYEETSEHEAPPDGTEAAGSIF